MGVRKRISIFLVIVIIFAGAITILNKSKLVREEKLTSDIEKQIVRMLKKDINATAIQADVRIEKFEDIGNTRFILYSFNNPMVGYRHAGYAVYEIKSNSRYKRTDFAWSSANFNDKTLSTKEGSQIKNYAIVYGMNKANESQVYEYTNGTESRIEEFKGEYFFKKYPLGENTIGFRNIDSKK